MYGDIDVISAAENVGSNGNLDEAIDAWLDSDGHADNILGDYNLSGVGISEDADGQFYLTQNFVLGSVLSLLKNKYSSSFFIALVLQMGYLSEEEHLQCGYTGIMHLSGR